MQSSYNDKLKMYIETVRVCEAEPMTAGIPNFTDNLNELKTVISDLISWREQQGMNIKGYTNQKNRFKRELIELTLIASTKLVAFSVVNSDVLLQNKAYFTVRKLSNCPVNTLLDYGKIVYKYANIHLADLAAYNYNQTMLDELNAAINSLADAFIQPRNAIVNRSVATSYIKKLIEQADTLLKKRLDKLVSVISLENPGFVSLYKIARRIYSSGRREISIRGKITDAETLTPVFGVKVKLLETGKTIITSNTGCYRFKSLQGGNYTISVTRKLYNPQTLHNIAVIEGKLTSLDIRFQRIR